MAQTNFTPILTYKSDTASAVPSAGNLTNSANGAELAVNTADKRLFTKDSGGSVVELGTNPSSLTLPNGTANGVVYANGSKVLTTGSALTFDGTTFTVPSDIASPGSPIIYSYNGGSAGSVRAGIQFVGTDPSIRSYISGSEQMRLTSTGLGIGTSSPAFKLHVNGSGSQFALVSTTDTTSTTGVLFGDSASNTVGRIEYVHSSDLMQFYTAGAVKAILDSSGNLGLGVTPSAWLTYTALQIKNSALSAIDNNQIVLSQNGLYTTGSAWKYINTNYATLYQQTSGQHLWFTAPSGTAGNAISFTQSMSLTAAGDLLIGTTSGSHRITAVVNSGADRDIFLGAVSGVTNGFRVQWNHATSKIRVSIQNLPTSSSGLDSGTLYVDGGFLKVA